MTEMTEHPDPNEMLIQNCQSTEGTLRATWNKQTGLVTFHATASPKDSPTFSITVDPEITTVGMSGAKAELTTPGMTQAFSLHGAERSALQATLDSARRLNARTFPAAKLGA